MNLAQLLYQVGEVGIKNPNRDLDIKGYVNQAILYMAERHNFAGMHDIQQVTVPSAQTSVTMPDTFKELSEEQSPISFTYGLYRLPVMVTTRSRIEACGLWPLMNGPLSMPLPGGYLPIRVVFIEQNAGGQWTLNIPPQFVLTTAMVFNVQGYYYPRPLQQGTDSNALTANGQVAQAIVALAKAFAYLNDQETSKEGQLAMQRFEDLFDKLLYDDCRRKLQPVPLRM